MKSLLIEEEKEENDEEAAISNMITSEIYFVLHSINI